MTSSIHFMSNIKLFPQTSAVLVPLCFWCSNWGALNSLSHGPCGVLASSLGVKSRVWGLLLPSSGALWRRSREQISIVTEQAVFPERSVDSWQPISLPFSGQGAVASSRFPGRFEDYQSHLLGGGWMGLSLAVPRVKKRRKRSLKGHFFFFFSGKNERKRTASSLWVLPRPALFRQCSRKLLGRWEEGPDAVSWTRACPPFQLTSCSRDLAQSRMSIAGGPLSGLCDSSCHNF